VGERMILDDNAFVEGVFPAATVRKLTDEEMSVYRAPFLTPDSRRPTWRFPNELPIAGEPADVYSTLEKAHLALAQSSYPKLLFAGNPGALVSPAFAESLRRGLRTAELCSLPLAFTTCRRITLMLSPPTSKNGSSNWGLIPAQNRS
jgi:haloalkane dehalogenase